MPSRNSLQSPTVDIPKRLQLVGVMDSRDGTFNRDTRLFNCFVERDLEDGEYWVSKRPGFGVSLATITQGLSLNPSYGLYKFFDNTGSFQFLVVSHANLSKVDSTLFGPTVIGAIAASSNNYVFETVRSTPNFLAVLNDGAGAYYTDGVTRTDMHTLANFPANIVKGWAYLDGTLYVMSRTNQIFGSANLDDPTVWSALNVIIARNGSDPAVALTKHKEFVMALKANSTEFFYDNANPTGSPLSSLLGARIKYGCFSADSIQTIDDETFWMTAGEGGNYQIIRLTNLQPFIISTAGIERLLRYYQTSFTVMVSYSLKLAGHRFYCLSFNLPGFKQMTLVYDLDQKWWYVWFDTTGTGIWPIADVAGPTSTGKIVVQNYTTGNLHEVAEDYVFPTDNGSIIPVSIYTPDHDFGTQRNKNLAAMQFRADSVVGSVLKVRFSEDDYETWSNFREVDLSLKLPQLVDCGSFRERAWHLLHDRPTSFRIKTVDLQLDVGST